MSEEMRNALATWTVSKKWTDEGPKENPLFILSKAASTMNASEFTLPEELTRENEFPGFDKWLSKCNAVEKGKRMPHDPDANGIIARPIKTCYGCNKTTGSMNLIRCDYCPLYFHLECLTPPLSYIPKERWMCPNHVQHTLDKKFLTSIKFTPRIDLWNEHANGKLEEHEIKLKFLSKGRRNRDPPFRKKVCHQPSKHAAKVPIGIKNMYRKRVQDPGKVFEGLEVAEYEPRMPKPLSATPEEQAEWLSAVLKMKNGDGCSVDSREDASSVSPSFTQEEIPKKETTVTPTWTSSQSCRDPPQAHHSRFETTDDSSDRKPSDVQNDSRPDQFHNQNSHEHHLKLPYTSTIPTDHPDSGNKRSRPQTPPASLHSYGMRNGFGDHGEDEEGTMDEDELNTARTKRRRFHSEGSPEKPISGPLNIQNPLPDSLNNNSGNDPKRENNCTRIISQGNEITSNPVEPFPNTDITISQTRGISQPRATVSRSETMDTSLDEQPPLPSPALIGRLKSLKDAVKQMEDHPPDDLDIEALKFFANQRLQQLQPVLTPRVQTGDVRFSEKFSKTKPILAVVQLPSDIAYPVQRAVVSLGKTGCNIDLSKGFPYCARLDKHHATIFFDRVTRQFELLNYSPHGTHVDGILYKSGRKVKPASEEESPEQAVRELEFVAKLNQERRKEDPGWEKAVWDEKLHRHSCPCEARPEVDLEGWEGSSVLRHGSIIQIGCFHLVFATVDPL